MLEYQDETYLIRRALRSRSRGLSKISDEHMSTPSVRVRRDIGQKIQIDLIRPRSLKRKLDVSPTRIIFREP